MENRKAFFYVLYRQLFSISKSLFARFFLYKKMLKVANFTEYMLDFSLHKIYQIDLYLEQYELIGAFKLFFAIIECCNFDSRLVSHNLNGCSNFPLGLRKIKSAVVFFILLNYSAPYITSKVLFQGSNFYQALNKPKALNNP